MAHKEKTVSTQLGVQKCSDCVALGSSAAFLMAAQYQMTLQVQYCTVGCLTLLEQGRLHTVELRLA